MKILDSHQHLWEASCRSLPRMDGPWADPPRARFDHAALVAETERCGVTATVAVQATSSLRETEDLLSIAEDSEVIAGVVAWVDLAAPDADDQLARLKAARGGRKLVGIRHQVADEPDPRWLVRPAVMRGLRAVARAGLVYDLLIKPSQLAAAVELARLNPDLPLVLDHLGKPGIARLSWEPWASGLRRLAVSSNVSTKLSGLVTEADPARWRPEQIVPYVRHAIELFGPDRLLFGSDWPGCTLTLSYEGVVRLARSLVAELDGDQQAAIFAGNAERIYGLGERS